MCNHRTNSNSSASSETKCGRSILISFTLVHLVSINNFLISKVKQVKRSRPLQIYPISEKEEWTKKTLGQRAARCDKLYFFFSNKLAHWYSSLARSCVLSLWINHPGHTLFFNLRYLHRTTLTLGNYIRIIFCFSWLEGHLSSRDQVY